MSGMFEKWWVCQWVLQAEKIELPYQRSGIEILIDDACGYDAQKEFIKEFTKFVMQAIYIPLISR